MVKFLLKHYFYKLLFFTSLLFILIKTVAIANPLSPAVITIEKQQYYAEVVKDTSVSIRLKLQDSVAVTLENGLFTGSDTTAANRLNTLLAGQQITSTNKLISNTGAPAPDNNAASQSALRTLHNYYTIKFATSKQRDAVMAQLAQDPAVAGAYAPALPAPAPTVDYRPNQTYAQSAPTGMGIKTAYTASVPASNGSQITLMDIEYSRNLNHEDLSQAKSTSITSSNGTAYDPFGSSDHGTAVNGITSASVNDYGIDGLSPNARLTFMNASNTERFWDLANSVILAANQMKAGDVMLIEQQTYGPNNNFVAVEWVPEIYDAIVYAVSRGIIVIEPAGNGNSNYDDASLFGTRFPFGKADSGAIMVGAGEFCNTNLARSRLNIGSSSSNYGNRVDVQGPGDCVFSLGYGDLAGSGNNAYTATFSGTSSASAIVATAAASISSAYSKQTGTIMTPAQLRTLLIATGTAQNSNGLSGKIGPQPNVEAALKTFIPPANNGGGGGQPINIGTPTKPTTYGKLSAGNEFRIKLANISATVIGNLTVTQPESLGYMSVYPCADRPANPTSNTNFYAGDTIATGIIAKTDAQGYLCFYTSSTTHFIWDQTAATTTDIASPPIRIIDTRYDIGQPIPANTTHRIATGSAGKVIVGTLTIDQPAAGGFATMYTCANGLPVPMTSNINFNAGQTIANTFVAKADANGEICFISNATTHMIIDVTGVTTAVSTQNPQRLYDSRNFGAVLPAGSTISIQLGAANTPFIGNLTATSGAGVGYATVYPCSDGLPQPLTSNLNFGAGQTIANLVIAQSDAQGTICIYISQQAHIIWDTMGSISGTNTSQPVRVYDSRG